MDNAWIFAVGFVAQGLFAARMLVQWFRSEKAHKVVNPTVFWILSLVASLLFFYYGWLRKDLALMLGQVIGYYVYIWNLEKKGVWDRLGNNVARIALLAVLLVIPPLALGGLAGNWREAVAALFHNDAIPHWLLYFGMAGQLVFSLRFLYQAFYSARRDESLLPPGFWLISLAGATLILIYGILRQDPVLILAQGVGIFTYLRNLMLWRQNRHA